MSERFAAGSQRQPRVVDGSQRGRPEAEPARGRRFPGGEPRRSEFDHHRRRGIDDDHRWSERRPGSRSREDYSRHWDDYDDEDGPDWRDRLVVLFRAETWRRIGDNLLGMAGAGSTSKRRTSGEQGITKRQRLGSIAFWAGVGIAPIAALLLLLGQGVAPLRAAAVLSVLAVVLIGLSVTFREDPAAIRRELEAEFSREVELVRADVATLRRGVQLTVNRELDRVRGEIEQARSVVHAQATRLPVPVNGTPPAARPAAVAAPTVATVNHARQPDRPPVPPRVEVRTAEYAPPSRHDDYDEDIHTVEPIRERYTQPRYSTVDPLKPISGDVLTPSYPEPSREQSVRWQLGRENQPRSTRRRSEPQYEAEYGGGYQPAYPSARGGRHSSDH